MYFNNLKKLRNEREITQKYIANVLNVKRSTYNSWERGDVMIPLEIADKLSIYYKVKLAYIIGIDKEIKYINDIKEINYDTLLNNLNKLKKERHQSFADIANNINCSRSICHRYFNGLTILPIDRLVLLAKFYNMDIDILCGKV